MYRYQEERTRALTDYIAASLGGVEKTKLLKLHYEIDFTAFNRLGHPITGAQYKHWDLGPVPIEIYHDLKMTRKPKLVDYFLPAHGQRYTAQMPDMSDFTEAEMRVIDGVIIELGKLSGQALVQRTHNDAPYRLTKKNDDIPYCLAPLKEKDWHTDPKDLEQIRNNEAYITGLLHDFSGA